MDLWIPGAPDPSIRDGINSIIDDYSNAVFEKKPHGIIFVNGVEVAHTLECPHCGEHFTSRQGSGIRRSKCLRCMAITCEKRSCIEYCTPFLRELGIDAMFGKEY